MKKVPILATFSLLIFLLSSINAQESNGILRLRVLDGDNNFFYDLKPADIEVARDKSIQKINSFELQKYTSVSLTIMIDASISQEKVLPIARLISKKIIEDALDQNNDRVKIVKFTGEVTVVQEFTNNFKQAGERLEKIDVAPYPNGQKIIVGLPPIVSKGQPQQATSLWDSLKKVAESMDGKSGTPNAIIILTDGVDTYSTEKRKVVLKNIAMSGISVFSIGIGDDAFSGVDAGSLRAISEKTGGEFFAPKKTKDIDNIAKRIKQNLRNSYSISFEDGVAKTGKLKIKLTNKELQNRGLKFIFPEEF